MFHNIATKLTRSHHRTMPEGSTTFHNVPACRKKNDDSRSSVAVGASKVGHCGTRRPVLLIEQEPAMTAFLLTKVWLKETN